MPHTTTDDYAPHLEAHGVRPTAMRLLVWRAAVAATATFTLADMEAWLPTADRSSLFRTLRLFTERHLLHETDDGTGQRKYCVCRCADSRHLNHVHFRCTVCGKTYCLFGHAIPVVSLPEGFTMTDAEYIIKGVCPECQSAAAAP